MKSLKKFKKIETVDLVTIKGGANVAVDTTYSNGWHAIGTSIDNGDGTWGWKDGGSGWSCSHVSNCSDCVA
jgi:hypothetical protein